MAGIPGDDLSQLFEETQSKTWPGFRRVLLDHKESKLTDVDSETIDRLLALTQQQESIHGTFPASEEQFQRLVSEELEKVTQVR